MEESAGVLDSIEPREQKSTLEDWQDSNKLLARWHLAIVCKQKGCLQKHWPASDTDHKKTEGKYFVLWQLLTNNAFQILCHFKWVEELAFTRALTWVLPQLQCTVAAHSLPLYSPPTILPERLARCLDSWAEPQQVYRLQFRGLAATRAGDGRVMRPCTTQRGARHKSRPTQGLRAHQRSWFRTPKPLISNREHSNSHNKSLNSGVVQR